MILTDRLNQLFAERRGKNFFPDGIVDEDRYSSARYKILYMLKEVHASEDEEGDLRTWIKGFAQKFTETGKIYQTWRRTGELAYLILQDFPDYSTLRNASREDIAESILSLAVVNLKKTAGSGKADNEKVYEEARKDFSLWKSEIDIIHPDIVLCGGTYQTISTLFMQNKIVDRTVLQETPNGLPYFRYNDGAFVNFFHPLAHIQFPAMYSYLKEGVKFLLTN